jgi:hypothetical protein
MLGELSTALRLKTVGRFWLSHYFVVNGTDVMKAPRTKLTRLRVVNLRVGRSLWGVMLPLLDSQ